MPVKEDVDGLSFVFPTGWKTTKFDDLTFYRNHFLKMHDGIKAVDIVAISPNGATLWLIEVKDFRRKRREKSLPLYEEIWQKVFATLAALLPTSVNASTDREQQFAKFALKVSKVRVVFQGEQPRKPSKLFPQSFTPADLQKKFKMIFKAIDPHALVVSSQDMPSQIPWTVQP
ncbi:hypothetical protein [Desulfovibrio piger]|uniref:Cysteinyl-tRNA synthetase n=1 Tax=Desulfovibrio piger TaxID=901 RepID=A0A848CFP5_9BACT|nr:hypothetical protein [Desulfovibrio piger]NME52226.1 hypothetical protein [Desulfovibrio piger]